MVAARIQLQSSSMPVRTAGWPRSSTSTEIPGVTEHIAPGARPSCTLTGWQGYMRIAERVNSSTTGRSGALRAARKVSATERPWQAELPGAQQEIVWPPLAKPAAQLLGNFFIRGLNRGGPPGQLPEPRGVPSFLRDGSDVEVVNPGRIARQLSAEPLACFRISPQEGRDSCGNEAVFAPTNQRRRNKGF